MPKSGRKEAIRLSLLLFSTQSGRDSTMVSVELRDKYPSFSL
jgi:hypothetical protein